MGMATDRGTNTSFQSQSQTQSLRHEDSIGEKRDRFQQALKQFESVQSPEDFAESARIFESIQGDDFESGAVYYNMGNAFLRAGQYGKAVLSFRKAQRFRTNDPYLEANLRYAIQSAPGTLPAAPGAWYRSLLFWSDWLAPYPKLLLGSTALCLASLLSFWSTIKRRSGLRWLSLGLSLCFAILFLDGAWSATSSMKPLHGVITKETIARKGMAETYAPAFDKPLQDGAEFVILNRTNQWFFGRFEGVGDGWISRDAAAD